MSSQHLGFFGRLILLCILPWKVLFNGVFAHRVKMIDSGSDSDTGGPEAASDTSQEPVATESEAQEAVAEEQGPSEDAAMHLLSLFQRDGRLIDFLNEDVQSFSDAEIGAAARVVHEGCQKVMKHYFVLEPVRSEEEESRVTIDKGFNPQEIRLTGNVVGEAPFQGVLAHGGWRVTEVKMPDWNTDQDSRIIAPAEVEI